MKSKNIIIAVFAVVFLCHCKTEEAEPYTNEQIVTDNAQAALYFHTLFREAEAVWAFIHEKDYEEGTYTETIRPNVSKEMVHTINNNAHNVTVTYSTWTSGHLTLMGKITVIFGKDSYRRDAMVANIYFTDISINWQSVVGEASMKYISGENDRYSFTLIEGAKIFEEGHGKPELISATINNGQYERLSKESDGDLWAYAGEMKGQLRNDPSLSYTNTVAATLTVNNETVDGRVYYNMACKTARQGISRIKIEGRPDVYFEYFCSEYGLLSVTHIE